MFDEIALYHFMVMVAFVLFALLVGWGRSCTQCMNGDIDCLRRLLLLYHDCAFAHFLVIAKLVANAVVSRHVQLVAQIRLKKCVKTTN